MQTPYWEYFLALEDDLIRAGRYVEFDDRNLEVFSIEFARILLAGSSEVDVVAKALCNKIDKSKKAENIQQYRKIIVGRFPNFSKLEIEIPRYSMVHSPWKEWIAGKTPSWWGNYNKVKHQRADFFHKATLKNALGAVCGLFALLLYYYKLVFPGQNVIDPWPRLIDIKSDNTGDWKPASFSYGYQLDDDI